MRQSLLKKLSFLSFVFFSMIVFVSCSPKKNTAASRNYQAFITRYNIYYNGDTHFKETLKELENTYEDDYSRMVFMHPTDAYSDPQAPQPQGSFDRSIEKAQKAIQLRSMKKRPSRKSGKSGDAKYREWMQRDEYNPFLHNAWMMMGRSQYYNGDFLGASSTFFYITKHFKWLPQTVTEAQLWQARCYCSIDWLFEAENIITHIKEDALVNSSLKGLYFYVYADLLLKQHEYEQAIPYLVQTIKYAKGSQKTRLNFLLGQIYSLVGKKAEAYQAFKHAGSSSGTSYRTKFNARIKQSEVYLGENIEPEVKALRRMVRFDRNKEYLDQIYYAIGNLYLSRRDTTKAIENYIIAAEKSTRNGIEKAISQITLGGLYFEQHNYEKAQPCYAEAIPLLPESYPDYALLKRRSDVLDELAVYSQNVTLQDSLLRLSEMTSEQQLEVVNKIIEELKKKEKEEEENAKREEYLAQQRAQGSNLQNNASAPTTFTMNTDDSWYFYNSATRNAGKTSFQKRWGSRKLEDDWRRHNKMTFSMDDFESDDDKDDDSDSDNATNDGENKELSKEDKELQQRENDPHYPEYYLKQIPKTDQEKMVANDIIQEGLYNMGIILKDKLEDFNSAALEFDRLLTRYPDNIYRLDTYYNLYLMYMRDNKPSLAEKYRALILKEFPESKYGLAMRDPNYLENLKTMDERQEQLYSKTYDDYINNRNKEVHAAYNQMMKQYPLSKIMPKFMFLHALAYVTEKNPEQFNATLKELLERYPDTDITPLASSYLTQMAKGRKLQSGMSNLRGMIWNTRLTNDSTAMANEGDSIKFELAPTEPQLFILLYPTDSVSSNQLLFDVARHNFTSFVVRDFDLEQMNFGQLGLLIIKGFENIEELNHYRQVMEDDDSFFLPQQVHPVVISVKNFNLLLREGRSFEEYFDYIGETIYKETEEKVLPPEIFGESEGIPVEQPEQETPVTIEEIEITTPQEETQPTSISEEQPLEIESEVIPAEQPEPEAPIMIEEIEITEPEEETERPTSVSDEEPLEIESVVIPAEQPEPKNPVPVEEIEITEPQEKEEQPTVPKEQPTPSPKGQPKQNSLPEYPEGSEGDDPLLDI